MFVRVTKDGRTFHKVSEKVFQHSMRKLGYRVVDDNYYKEPVEQKSESVEVSETSEEKQTMEEPEIPVSDMSKEELMEYAKRNGINTSQATNVRQARAIISAAIAKNKK